MDELRLKSFPADYATDARTIIDAISFTGKPAIIGSMSYKASQYSADYDMMESVRIKSTTDEKAIAMFAQGLQRIVQHLLVLPDVFIGDIKCGSVDEWIVVPATARIERSRVVGYNGAECRERLRRLKEDNVVTADEYEDALKLLVDRPSINQFLDIKEEVRFNVVRWTPTEILRGVKVVRGRNFTLADGITSGITKIDVIGYVDNNRFTDFSIFYFFFNGTKSMNPQFGSELTKKEYDVVIAQKMREDVYIYLRDRNYFKAAKRLFSIATLLRKDTIARQIMDITNSELGRMYSLISDIKTAIEMLENIASAPMEKIAYEIDMFHKRIGNMYSLTPATSARLSRLVDSASRGGQREKIIATLKSLQKTLEADLETRSKATLTEAGLLPLPKWARP